MTYAELAAKIATLTPEQQQCEAKFVEPYDEGQILAIGNLDVVDEGSEIVDPSDGETLRGGAPYLEC